MRTVKIFDTCTLINIFDGPDSDLADLMDGYDLVTTDDVIGEYVRKYPRHIPGSLNVMGLTEEGRSVMDELEFLFPRLGTGERSVMALAMSMAASERRAVIITDDEKARKKLTMYLGDPAFRDAYPGISDIVLGNKTDLRRHLVRGREV